MQLNLILIILNIQEVTNTFLNLLYYAHFLLIYYLLNAILIISCDKIIINIFPKTSDLQVKFPLHIFLIFIKEYIFSTVYELFFYGLFILDLILVLKI